MDPDDYGAKLLYALCTPTKQFKSKRSSKMCMPKIEEYGNNKFSLKYMNSLNNLFLDLL